MVFVFHEKKWVCGALGKCMVSMKETYMENGFEWHYCNMGSNLVAFFGMLAA